MSSEIKNALKEAREAIKNKDYQAVAKLCKGILKEEKDNYMALVFLGVSLQEVGPTEQALNAFRKAIQANSSNVLAWNGLANYYEKFATTDASKKELIDVYTTLIDLEKSEKKVVEFCEKIVACTKEVKPIDCQKIAEVLKKASECQEFSEMARKSILEFLAAFMANLPDLDDILLNVYEDCLLKLIQNPATVTSMHYANYLKILYKQDKHELLFESAKKMRSLYQSDNTSLEWMCKIYNKLQVENNQFSDDEMLSICETLLASKPESATGLFTRAILFYKEKKLLEAKDYLIRVTTLKPGFAHACILLSQCFLKMGLYKASAESAKKASINSSNIPLKNILFNVLAEALSRGDDKSDWDEVITMCNEAKEKNSLPCLIRALINLNDLVSAENLLKQYSERNHDYVLLNALLLKKQGKLQGALDFLEEQKIDDDSEIWTEIGQLHWQLGNHVNSLIPFLKATKLNPNSYVCFVNLALYYQKFNDLDKARRCYEKAFKISNQSDEGIAVELSKIYCKQRKWDANLTLLSNLTNDNSMVEKNSWAYMQLGLSYLEQGDHTKAIDTLRHIIRMDPYNSSCWESLADAYMARGAYTSSLKSYQKAAELNPSSLYPQLQVANIKQLLDQYSNAKMDFEKIITQNRHYIPALKGLGETCLNQAKQYRKNQLLGLARDCAEFALDTVTLALQENSNLSCLWKLAGDCCYLVATLPERYCCLLVLRALAEGNDSPGNKPLERDDLYTLSARCYCKAVNLIDDNILIWHDLAQCYFSHARSLKVGSRSCNLYDRGLAAIHHCVSVNSTHWQHWNLMGNISFFKEPKNYALAQHAFIKAVTIEKNSAVAWCNLGALYLNLAQIKLANEAFSQAQRSDPNYVNCWVGQALIAESLNHEDAMDLFRHSTQLDFHPQGAVGYGYWVCRSLLENQPKVNVYAIENMHAVPVACDALTWYTENDPDDPCAWNLLGLLRERMGLKFDASRAFRNALRLCDRESKDQVNVNYGRSLIRVGKFTQAVEMYKDVKQATFNSGSGLALALFKDRQYEESYEAYESALHWLTDEKGLQSDLLVALASMAFLFQGPEAAKTLLFQSTQLESPSPWGLYATLSLGLLQNDLNLAHLVLKELTKFKDDLKCLPHYAVLMSHVYLLQGEHKKAVCELSKLLHRHPNQATLWLFLSVLLLRLHNKRPITSAAINCAQIAMKLGQTNMDVTKVLCLVSLGQFLIRDGKNALKSAQRAVHYFPDVPECWAVLISALSIDSQKNRNFSVDLIKKVHCALKPSAALASWLQAQA